MAERKTAVAVPAKKDGQSQLRAPGMQRNNISASAQKAHLHQLLAQADQVAIATLVASGVKPYPEDTAANTKSVSDSKDSAADLHKSDMVSSAKPAPEWHHKKNTGGRNLNAPFLGGKLNLDLGVRNVYSTGRTEYNAYYKPTVVTSRLTYSGLHTQTTEFSARLNNKLGDFVRAEGGTSKLSAGTNHDQDFAPLPVASDTVCSHVTGGVDSVSVDAGRKISGNKHYNLWAFGGYKYYHETVTTYGCTQVGQNMQFCPPLSIPENLKVVTEETNWHSLRAGVIAEYHPSPGLSLTGEGAGMVTFVKGEDTHWLRIGQPGDFTGPIPQYTGGAGVEAKVAAAIEPIRNIKIETGLQGSGIATIGFAQFNGEHTRPDDKGPGPGMITFTTVRGGAFVGISGKF